MGVAAPHETSRGPVSTQKFGNRPQFFCHTPTTNHHLIRIFIFTLHYISLYVHIEPAYKPNSVTYPSYPEKLNA